MAEPNEKPVVAVFDFDGTITYVDSFLPFLRHIGGFFGFWFGMISLSPVLAMHAAGFIKNWQAKERFLTWFSKTITRRSCRTFQGIHQNQVYSF